MSPKNAVFRPMAISSVDQAIFFLNNAILFYGNSFQVNRPITAYGGCDALTSAQQRAFEGNRQRAITALRREGICPERWCAANAL